MSPLETGQSLIVRLKSEQNELAWRDFVCAYEGFLNQLARRQGVPERHVPDVTQQILLMIARSIDGWKDDGNDGSTLKPSDFIVDFLQPAQNKESLGRLGNIDIRQFIGQGAYGIVLKGFQEELNHQPCTRSRLRLGGARRLH